jgi:hypothetical protein
VRFHMRRQNSEPGTRPRLEGGGRHEAANGSAAFSLSRKISSE